LRIYPSIFRRTACLLVCKTFPEPTRDSHPGTNGPFRINPWRLGQSPSKGSFWRHFKSLSLPDKWIGLGRVEVKTMLVHGGFKIHRGFHGWFKGNNILLALPLKNGYKNPSFTRHGLAATLSGTIANRVGS